MAEHSSTTQKPPAVFLPAGGGPLFVLMLGFFCFYRPYILLGDGGTCRHMLTGEYILQHGQIPLTNYVSALDSNSPWLTHELVCDLIFGPYYLVGGMNWVVLTAGLAIVFSTIWSYQMGRARGVGPIAGMIMLVAIVEAASIHWSARPHLFTYLTFVAVYYLVYISRASFKSRLIATAATMFVWGNLHGSYLLGLMVIGSRLIGDLLLYVIKGKTSSNVSAEPITASSESECSAESVKQPGQGTESGNKVHRHVDGQEIVEENAYATAGKAHVSGSVDDETQYDPPAQTMKQGLVLLLITAVASCLNSRGVEFFSYVLGYMSNPAIRMNSDEWRSIDFSYLFQAGAFLLVFAFVATVWIYARKKPHPGEFLSVGLMFLASVYAMRLVPYFVLIALPAVGPQWADICKRALHPDSPKWLQLFARKEEKIDMSEKEIGRLIPVWSAASLVLAGVFLFAPFVRIPDFDPTRLPVAAVSTLAKGKDESMGFCRDNWGDYLYWRLRKPIFIDDKTDFYSAERLQDYAFLYLTYPGWEKVLAKYKFSFVLVPRGLPLTFLLEKEGQWQKSYEDGTAVLFQRKL